MSYRLGIDSGGTFTDAVLFDEASGRLSVTKVSSTPANPSIGVFKAIAKIVRQNGIKPEQVASLIHGTTVATNALLEHKGVRTALVTTRGFKDILSIVRQDRPKLYDFFERRPEPLVPRRLRFEVDERTAYDGRVKKALTASEIEALVASITASGVSAVAIGLLHSYVNATHEQYIGEQLRNRLPHLAVTLSSDILPEIREYERISTTAINAYVMPLIERYLKDLEQKTTAAGYRFELNVMQSNGGITPARAAGQKSVATILSGPAGGVIGSQWLTQLAGQADAITLDIGGTSSDICLISRGEFLATKESEIGGHAIKVPMIDINTVGAGGGSIAWIDPGGALRVGPHSAGADPGPACYGRGGSAPTVTDAQLVLGRLNPDYYAGGEIQVDPERSKAAIQESVADPLGMKLEAAAEGILRVINANMIRGIRRVSVERGFDPRGFALMAFGGGGPLHATELGRELKTPRVIIPPTPGVNSAVGLLIADFRYDFSRTYLKRLSTLDHEELYRQYQRIETEAVARMTREQIPRDRIVLQRVVDMRYLGQGYEMEIPLAGGALEPAQLTALVEDFHQAHRRSYGYHLRGEEMEIIHLRLTAVGLVGKPEFIRHDTRDAGREAEPAGRRSVYMDGRWIRSRVFARKQLQSGQIFSGPAVVEQLDATTLLLPGQKARVDEYLNLIIQLEETV